MFWASRCHPVLNARRNRYTRMSDAVVKNKVTPRLSAGVTGMLYSGPIIHKYTEKDTKNPVATFNVASIKLTNRVCSTIIPSFSVGFKDAQDVQT